MSKQIVNFNIKKSQRNLSAAIEHLVRAAEALQAIDEEWMPARLQHSPDFLLDIAAGFMEIYDDYASELLYPR